MLIKDEEDPLDKIPRLGDDDSQDRISNIEQTIKNIENIQQNLTKTIRRKSILIMSVIGFIVIVMGLVGTQVLLPSGIFNNDLARQDEITSGYFIENLKGEKVNTWVAWKIMEGDFFHIHVIDSPQVTQERLDIINNVIYSEEFIEHNNQVYYKGWKGALGTISDEHKFPIPIHYHSALSDSGTGHIVIKLTNLRSTDGYSGYTRSQVDESNNQILKSQITIYNVDELSMSQLETITRHELGHAFGLAHSDNPDSLMHETIKTEFPYITHCTIEAISGLYDGNEKDTVTCEN